MTAKPPRCEKCTVYVACPEHMNRPVKPAPAEQTLLGQALIAACDEEIAASGAQAGREKPFEFYQSPWWKDATRQLCADGWVEFVLSLNCMVRDAKDAYDAVCAERDEWARKYRDIETANAQLTKNDHVNFGALISERDALRAENERLRASGPQNFVRKEMYDQVRAELAEAKDYRAWAESFRKQLREERDAARAELKAVHECLDSNGYELPGEPLLARVSDLVSEIKTLRQYVRDETANANAARADIQLGQSGSN